MKKIYTKPEIAVVDIKPITVKESRRSSKSYYKLKKYMTK